MAEFQALLTAKAEWKPHQIAKAGDIASLAAAASSLADTVKSTLSVGGAAHFASTVTIAGNTTLTGTLGVGGIATFAAKAEFDDDVCVSGNTILVGNLAV